MKIYVASSWRNQYQQEVVSFLRSLGHEVYDFKNPPKRSAFKWQDIDPNYENWSAQEYIEALKHPLAIAGYQNDFFHLKTCDFCVFVAPAGNSASFELGYAMGKGVPTIVYMPEPMKAELMFKDCIFITSMSELEREIAGWQQVLDSMDVLNWRVKK